MIEIVGAAEPDAIDRAARALERGEVIAIPTETIYGLAVLPRPASLERLLVAKNRSADKGIQLLVDSVAKAAQLAVLPPAAEQLAAAFWPGGLTLIVERRPAVDLPLLLGGGRPTLGVRLPDHALPRALARRLGPLAASSANVSGRPPATTVQMVVESLADVVSLVIDDGPVGGGVPSTVVDCTSATGAPVILRAGAIPVADILAALGQDYTAD